MVIRSLHLQLLHFSQTPRPPPKSLCGQQLLGETNRPTSDFLERT